MSVPLFWFLIPFLVLFTHRNFLYHFPLFCVLPVQSFAVAALAALFLLASLPLASKCINPLLITCLQAKFSVGYIAAQFYSQLSRKTGGPFC
jgi:hypothetical protein